VAAGSAGATALAEADSVAEALVAGWAAGVSAAADSEEVGWVEETWEGADLVELAEASVAEGSAAADLGAEDSGEAGSGERTLVAV